MFLSSNLAVTALIFVIEKKRFNEKQKYKKKECMVYLFIIIQNCRTFAQIIIINF